MKTKIILFLCACWSAAGFLAASEVAATSRGVEINSNSELLGPMRIKITEDAFPDASPTNPVYLEVHLENGLALRETLVDPRASAQGPSPIYLPIGHYNLLVQAGAAPDTLSIVRWIAGEPSYWLKIQRSSRTWLTDKGQTQAPDDSNRIELVLSSSARRYWLDYGEAFSLGRANLPYATRDLSELSAEDVTRSVSVNFCADIRSAVYINRGTPTNNVPLVAGLRAVRLAENALTVEHYRDIPAGENYPFTFQLPEWEWPDDPRPFLLVGRTYYAFCQSFYSMPQPIPSCALSETGLTDVTIEARGFRWECWLGVGPYYGSRFQFRWPNNQAPVGFRVQTDKGGGFIDAESISGLPNTVLLEPESFETTAAVSPPYAYLSDIIEISGEPLATAAEIVFRPEDPNGHYDELTLSATMRAAMNRAVTTDDLNMVMTSRIASKRPPEDYDPAFSGPEQHIGCPTFYRVLTDYVRFGYITDDCPNP